MNLYKISQTKNKDYDTYDSAIVCAASACKAKNIRPCCIQHKKYYGDGTGKLPCGHEHCRHIKCSCDSWVSAKDIKVEYVGKAKRGIKEGIVVASFNAG